ncbi:unnamed protein product, partial [Closterium sp. NIES-53]
MAAQELRWLTYLLTDLGEQPRSPPVLYVDNKAMLALCREHRLEHRTKHIALRYFLARELQQRGQLRLAYVASEANTADIFTKALAPGDHQRFCTLLACFALLDWSLFDVVVIVTARRTLGKHILSSVGLSSDLGVGLSATLGARVALSAPTFLGVLHVVVSADCRFIPREIFWLAPTWCWRWSGYVNIGALVIIRFRQILVERRWEQEHEHGVVVDVRGHRTRRNRRNRRSRGSWRHWRSRRSRRRRRLWWLWRVWRYAAIPPVSCNTVRGPTR